MKALNCINLGYQRLLSFEVDGGGFEWFGQAPAHNVLTAYGLMEFADMSRVHEIDRAVISRTRRWLLGRQGGDGSWTPTSGGIAEGAINNYQGQKLRTTAYISWALAQTGEVDGRSLDWIARTGAGSEDTYTLALCANALVAGGHRDAAKFLGWLEKARTEEEKFVHWGSRAQGVTYSRGTSLEVETTALAACAFISAKKQPQIVKKALGWLVSKKDARGTWHSTQATVLAMRALLAGTGPMSSVEGKMTLSIGGNGREAKKLEITEETADVYRLVSLRELVRSGGNTVSLKAAGKGTLAYQIVATHYLPWKSADEPAEKPITIDVAYDTRRLRRNDTLKCSVTVRYNRREPANMTIVDLGVPPGFAVETADFQALKDRGVIERYSVTGRQVTLYFRRIDPRKPVNFEYRLRAKYPVKVKTPPSTVYQYYEPKVRDQSAPVELTVL
jgi:uncharacterized protein YfaS (alpha-2-macroglobulin family)